ncbi:MAG: hypothetical protein KBT11_07635 [Treponema sp.]|nr:hypothetical protein [Candidatus Treponema equifaecale]
MKKSIFRLSAALLCSVFFFTGCDNFLDGTELKNEIDKTIAYASQDYCKIEISSNSVETSKLVPAVNLYEKSYKQNDTFNLSFEPTEGYQFLYWQAIPSDSISFGKIREMNTTATILRGPVDETVVIKPVCALRPIATVTPDETGDAKPKNSSIIINFNYPMTIPESADDPEYFLDDISVEIDGVSILDYYEAPVARDQNTQIFFAAKKDKLLDFTTGTKVVNVTIPKKMYYTTVDGVKIPMAADKKSQFAINYKTIESAILYFPADVKNGSLDRTGVIEKNLKEFQVVNFTMNDNCMFAGWSITSEHGEVQVSSDPDYTESPAEIVSLNGRKILRLVDPSESDAAILSTRNIYRKTIEVLSECEEVMIRPVSYVRPYIKSVNPSSSGIFPKNSAITIDFSQEMDISAEDLSRVSVTVDGVDQSECFTASLSSDKAQITFSARKDKMIDNESGTKTVVVAVPSDFSAIVDGVKVNLAGGYTHSYRIDSSTNEKADVIFKCEDAGNSTIDKTGNKSYNIGNSFTVKLKLDPEYDFDEWFVGFESGSTVSQEILRTTVDQSAMILTVEVLDTVKNVEIYPKCHKKLVVVDSSQLPKYTSGGTYCDSEISLKFNMPVALSSFRFADSELPANCEKLLDEDSLCYAYVLEGNTYFKNIVLENAVTGENIGKAYGIPELSSDKKSLTIKPLYEKLLLENGSSSLVTVAVKINSNGTVMSYDGVYMDGEGFSWQYRLNSKRENQPPEVRKIILAKNSINIQKAKDDGTGGFIEKPYSDEWTADDYKANHTNKVHIYAKAYDGDSQPYRIKVKETLIRKWNSDQLIENSVSTEKYSAGKFSKVSNEEGVWEGEFVYNFDCEDDGIVKLEVAVEDFHGNPTNFVYYVNKDTQIITRSVFTQSENGVQAIGSSRSYSNYNEAYYADRNCYSDIDYMYKFGNAVYFDVKASDSYLCGNDANSRAYSYVNDFEYEIRWSETKEGLESDTCHTSGRMTSSQAMVKYVISGSKTYTHCCIGYIIPDLDRNKSYYLKAIAFDEADSEYVVYSYKPKAPEIVESVYGNDGSLKVVVNPVTDLPEGSTVSYEICYSSRSGFEAETFNGSSFTLDSLKYQDSESNEVKFSVRAVISYKLEKYDQDFWGFAQKYGGQFSLQSTAAKGITPDVDATIEVEEPSVSIASAGPNTGFHNLTFTVQDNDFDKLYVVLDAVERNDQTGFVFERGAKRLTAPISTNMLYENDSYLCKIIGEKGGKINSREFKINTTGVAFNVPPKINTEYFTIDTHGDFMIVNAPVSKVNIDESKIICYCVPFDSNSGLYNSLGYSNAAYGADISANGKIDVATIKSHKKIPVSYYSNSDKTKIKVPIKELPNLDYLMCFDITDDFGNNVCASAFYLLKSAFKDEGHNVEIDASRIGTGSTLSTIALEHIREDAQGNASNYVVFDNALMYPSRSNITTSNQRNCQIYKSELPVNPTSYKNNTLHRDSDDFFKVYIHTTSNTMTSFSNGLLYWPTLDEYGAFMKNERGYNDPRFCSQYEQTVTPRYIYMKGSEFANNQYYTTSCTYKEMKEGLSAAFLYFTKHPDVTDLTGTDEIVLNIDQPCLIQTLVSDYDWTEQTDSDYSLNKYTAEKKAGIYAMQWEMHTLDENIKQPKVLRPTTPGTAELMLYRIPVSDVPRGKYYAVVAHFADGTSAISSVRQK